MSASDLFETDLLELIFTNANIALIGDATGLRGSSSAGSLYLSLHTASPGETGTQSTSEANYTGYARVAVGRTSGFSVTGNAATNVADVVFGKCTAGSNTITHFGIGTTSSGTGYLMFHGALSVSLAVSANIKPTIEAGALVVTSS